MQLGHGAPGPTSKRYLCNLIIEDDVPACYPKQIIVLGLDGIMTIQAQKKTQGIAIGGLA